MATSWEAYKKKRKESDKSSSASWNSYAASREADKLTRTEISPLAKVVKEDIAPVKEDSLLEKIGYTAKSLGSGILSGLSGVLEAGTTEIANNLDKGQKDDYKITDSLLYLLNPTIGMQMKMTESIQESAKILTDKNSKPLEKATGLVNNAVTDALNMIPGKDIFDETTKIAGKIAPEGTSKKVMEASNEITKPVYDLQQDIYEEGQQYGGLTQFVGETASTVGRMIPSIITSLLTKNPQAGLAVMATGVKGSSTTEALNKGAELNEAIEIGNTKGMIEYGTSMLFGGVNVFGKGALDDIITKGIDKKVKNEVLNYFAQQGVGLAGEVVEETISDILNTTIDKGTVDPNAKYTLEDWGEMAPVTILSTMVVNALTGGYGKSSFRNNAARMQENQAINAEVEARVKESALAGITLTNQEKSTIEQEVRAEFEQSKQAPTDNTAQVEGLQQAIEAKQQELTQTQDVREQQIIQEELNILQEELNEATNAQQITNEADLRKQNYVYQAQETDSDIKKAVYESASQVMNNTEKSRKLVEVVAKIAEEKGTTYKFTNNEQLKQMGYAKDNVTVNGLVNENGEVLINVDSAKYLNRVVGHETTHLLEGTQEYDALKQVAIEYAKSKGDYDTKMAQLHSLYKDTNANLENELVSDIVGDYLFTDDNFVKELSVKQPTLFEKIKNFISDLVVKFKGTDQEKQLRQLQRSFEKAYKAEGKQTSSETKYSIQGLEHYTDNEIKSIANDYIQQKLEENDLYDVTIKDTAIHGSRGRGTARVDSDLDIVVEYEGDIREDTLFEILNEDPMYIDSIQVDINPITADKTGTLADYMERSKAYDKEILSKNKPRYSLSEEGKMVDTSTNEEVRLEASETGTHGTLMAIHNLNVQKLQGAKELGGFPFPSIAITNPSKINHSAYGDISVLFDKSTIDPVNKKNKVYSRDAYTPRFPRLEYKANSEALKDLRSRFSKLGHYADNEYVSKGNSFLDNIEDTLNNNGGIEGLIDRAKDNKALKYLYIKEKGIPFTEQYKEESYSSAISNELLQKFLDNYKGDKDSLNQLGYEEVNALRDELEQLWIEENFKEPEAKAFLEKKPDYKPDLNYRYLNNIVMGAYKLHKYGNRRVLDTSKTNDLINSTVNQEEFESWLRNELKDIVSKKGLRNNKDYYTPSGNPRSFEQLHDEYNLDNVVKIMTALDDTGSEGFFTGINNIAGNASIRFDSITEIKAKEDLIQSVSEEEYSAILDDINNRLRNVENEIIERGHKNSDNPFIAMDNLTQSIATVARKFGENKRVTPATITKELNEWGFYPTQEESQTILNMFSEMRELPTEYFEAKPKRAVRFDEAAAIVVPNNIDNNIKQDLINSGLNIVEYDPNIEGDRQRVINQFDDLKFSLSAQNEEIAPIGNWNVRGEDVRLQVEEAITPLQEKIETLTEQLDTVVNSLEQLQAPTSQDIVEQQGQEAFDTITDEHAPSFEDTVEDAMWNEEFESTSTENIPSPFDTRDIDEVGNRKVKAYQYENPEVRPYFQQEAQNMMWDLNNTIKGERSFNDQLYYDSNGEQGFFGTSRQTTEAIAYLKDKYGYSYAQIEKGLNDIIEDNGKENNAVAKRIEFMLDERLREGYTTSDGIPIPPNEEYIKFLEERQITEYNREISSTLTDADAPIEETIEAPIEETPVEVSPEPSESLVIDENTKGQLSVPLPETTAQNRNAELTDTSVETQEQEKVAQILSERPTQENKKQRLWAKFRAGILDKGSVFEDLSIKTKNRELMAKWDYALTSEARAQNVMMNGTYEYNKATKERTKVGKGLEEIRTEVGDKVQEFSEYLYHKHNVDRMSIESNAQARMAELRNTTLKGYDFEAIEALSRKRIPNNADKVSEQLQFKDVAKQAEVEINAAKEFMRLTEAKNKPVFGNSVTAEISQEKVDEFEMNNPEFMDWANDIYDYNKANLNQLVNSGVISQETADQFAEIYPHYVPIGRADVKGNAVNVPLDTNRTGVNAPIARATGGNSDILPLFDTMAKRTIQTYRAVAKNNFGVELKNTLNSTIDNQQTNVDEILDNVDQQESLLQEGKNGKAPTFTVFENGEKVTYEITEDMYNALKPVSDSSILSTTFKPFNKISSIHRGVLTEYNPVFMLTNAIKDSQDILLNSQHATKTYAKMPEAYAQILKKGYWYQEYMANGGEQNSYFDSQEGTFDTENKGINKILDLPPLKQISQINNVIEMSPRLAEYIASRESGRSIETSMLDAARVTTNFKAGGDITKWANRNGATFLNASVQGVMQQVRNVREANMNGLKGYANLASKFALAGVPAMILNAMLWGDDEDYEELSDYVKQSYWIVGKYGDGNFIRIPKGRMITVVQEALNQMTNLVTGNDEADLGQFLEIVGNNIAPNNPIENNILSPLIQAVTNKTWYGGDLVPTRLQDVPAEEQYDESTDKLSIAMGQATGISPYKINYVLDQYTGGVGDVFLPMMTQQAEGGKDDLASNLIAPLTNKFTVDSTMKNQSVNDLYDLSDKLTTKANSSKATDEDILRNKFVESTKSEMNELYKKKREIQNSNISDSQKYNQVREIQDQINAMAKTALNDYDDIVKESNYADVGGVEYYKNNEGQWKKINYEKEAKDLNEMNMSVSDKNTYFKTKNEINKIVGIVEDAKDDITVEDEDSEEYKDAIKYLSSEKKEDIVNKVINSGLADNQKAYLYKKFYNTDTIDTIVNASISVDDYLTYTTKEFKADLNAKGNAISGSRKEKVISYVNGLEMTIPQKAILIKSTNTFKFNDYNNDIASYVNDLDLEYQDKVKILKKLDMTVDSDGSIYWDN